MLPFQYKSPKSVLVVRNDKLGDFILCIPSLLLLRQAHPKTKIIMLVSSVTYELAQNLPHLIDEVILDVGKNATNAELDEMTQKIKKLNVQASISLFSSFHVARCLFNAEIPYRYAPKTKLAQVFYNRKITQRRSQSIQPEYAYNLELMEYFLTDYPSSQSKIENAPPYLKFDEAEVEKLKARFIELNCIKPDSKLVFIHPGDKGSAANLSIEQYAEIANHLISENHFLVLSAGPGEFEKAHQLGSLLKHRDFCILNKPSVIEYAKHVQFADLMICGSTGPLHIAGALNRNTLSFFPRTPATSMIRWQPINDKEKQLFYTPAEHKMPNEMSSIDVRKLRLKLLSCF